MGRKTTRTRKSDLRDARTDSAARGPDAPEAAGTGAPEGHAWRRPNMGAGDPVPASAAPEPAGNESPRLDLGDLAALADMDPSEIAALLDGSATGARIEVGAKVTGRITRIGREHAFVDVGGKSEAWLRVEELDDAGVGQEIEAFVLAADDQGVHLSRRLSGPAAAAFLDEAATSGVPVEGRITGRNPGGFDVRVGSARAFCPVSQIDRHPSADLDAYIGQTFTFKVLEAGDDVVLSRRALLEADLEERREAFWRTAQVGDVLEGVVTSVQPFGAFVDVGGAEGLVHKSELSWGDVADATKAATRGQRLQVRVVGLDHASGKVSLSARDPDLSPWNRVGTEFIEGGVYAGTVTGVTEFGAFVELAAGLQGLLHVSRAGGAANLPKVGEHVSVRLDGVDRGRERLSLALPDVAPAEGAAETGAVVEGTVRDVLRNGVLVDLSDGRTGWLPQKEVELPAGTVLAQRYRAGRKVSARVLEDQGDRGRVVLSQREVQDRAWKAQPRSAGSQSFGTLGDLLGKALE